MAYSTVISCDLCGAVGLHGDPGFFAVDGAIRNGGGADIKITRPGSSSAALLCTQCVEPMLVIARALPSAPRDDRLTAQVRTALGLSEPPAATDEIV
jgi:hypothetical protein